MRKPFLYLLIIFLLFHYCNRVFSPDSLDKFKFSSILYYIDIDGVNIDEFLFSENDSLTHRRFNSDDSLIINHKKTLKKGTFHFLESFVKDNNILSLDSLYISDLSSIGSMKEVVFNGTNQQKKIEWWGYEKSKFPSTLMSLESEIRAYISDVDSADSFQLEILWIKDLGRGDNTNSPAISDDGTIYSGTSKELYAINPNGTLKWSIYAGKDILTSPSIGTDGVIYIVAERYDRFSRYSYLLAINPDGTEKWNYNKKHEYFSGIAVNTDGSIYFVGVWGAIGNLYALSSQGQEKWVLKLSTSTSTLIQQVPTIGNDGTVYVGSEDKNVYAIYPDGTKKWACPLDSFMQTGISIGSDGTLYTGTLSGCFYAITKEGNVKWKFQTNDWISTDNATISNDGTIYFGSQDKSLYSLNADGTKKWHFTIGSPNFCFYSSPALGSDGTLYVGNCDMNMYALNPDGTIKWIVRANSSFNSSPVIDKNGIIYINRCDGLLYAIKSQCTGTMSSAWPLFLHDPQHKNRK